ncbi:beta-lactamase hydrolase domain-containing protein [Pantanalinema rosaneae CENA516]|uniref:beta-lactamase hydrolase domain-containing protein n=1 Tax=Pantanalinema rosaneae TaxID=1620701 RepID=UPI003D6DD457
MKNIKQLTDQLAVAMGQVTSEQLQQAAQAGFKSVLNLRSPNEEGVPQDEQQQAEQVGLKYVNIPVKPDRMSDDLADQVLQEIDQLPKPALIHCKSGMRSGAMTLMYVATQQGMTANEAMAIGKQNGFDCESSPEMKQFFEHYVDEHSQANSEE